MHVWERPAAGDRRAMVDSCGGGGLAGARAPLLVGTMWCAGDWMWRQWIHVAAACGLGVMEGWERGVAVALATALVLATAALVRTLLPHLTPPHLCPPIPFTLPIAAPASFSPAT
jgi:hypothetical protein